MRALALLLLPALRGQEPTIPDVRIEVAFPHLRLAKCTSIVHPPDGTDRLFVLEQAGLVRWFENRPDVRDAAVALDLRERVLSKGWEEGLLGIAFHPKYPENRRIFLQYSTPKSDPRKRHNVISRWTMNPERTAILPESEEILLQIPQPFENHNGGCLQFGPDGFLYIGLGDGGAAHDPHGNGQKTTTMLGKFLRIDVDRRSNGKPYAVPPDNPFVGRPDVLPEIWSTGWRNPWGYHFDRKTGELWSGDVGQDVWEEINVVRKGGNYGWNIREAAHPFQNRTGPGPYIDPIVEHHHREAKSITGGMVYRGRRRPDLDGVYLYGDFVTGLLWGLRREGEKVTAHRQIGKSNQIAIFGEDRDGEVYFSSFDGRIYTFR